MSKEQILAMLKKAGTLAAQAIQEKAEELTGTELNAEADFVPTFTAACAKMNMLKRKAGQADGFVCKSSAGRVVRLIQNYDSTIRTAEPEELPAQWRFVWSTDPAKALPFIALSTSPYDKDDCCTENGLIYRSKINGNVFAPSAYPAGWEAVE